jgi:acylphosphatase
MDLHLSIAGLVQGVGYRQWFRRQAVARSVRGWVRNRSDDTVEAVVCGAPADVDGLVAAAMNGPLGAKVDRIDRRDAAGADRAAVPPEGFVILPTV